MSVLLFHARLFVPPIWMRATLTPRGYLTDYDNTIRQSVLCDWKGAASPFFTPSPIGPGYKIWILVLPGQD